MAECTDRRDEWMAGWEEEEIGEEMDGWVDGWINSDLIDARKEGWMDEKKIRWIRWINRSKDAYRWMERWMDGKEKLKT